MRANLSLIWKEYREQRWFLLAALVIFCGFPLIEAAGRYLHPPTFEVGLPAAKPEFYSDAATGLVLGFGGLLAIFVAIGSTTRDLRDELHVFWRSRPVNVGRWMGIKYVAGLFTVLTACTIPMAMQLVMVMTSSWRYQGGKQIAGVVGIHTFTIVLIFSIAFLLGCLVRHATQAALLALAAALAVYFLPVVVAPLSSLSVFNLLNSEVFSMEPNVTPNPAGWVFGLPWRGLGKVIIEPRPWITFAVAMVGGGIPAGALALIAVRRDWRVEADRKAMHWSLGGMAMLLFGATAFQVGSDLKVQRQYELPGTRQAVADFRFDGRRGAMVLRDRDNHQYAGQMRVNLCSVEMAPDGSPRYGPVISPTDQINVPYVWNGDVLSFLPERPDRAYLLAEHSGWLSKPIKGRNYEITSLKLLTIDLTGKAPDPVLHRLDLLPLLPDGTSNARAKQVGDRLYVAVGETIAAVDLTGDVARVEAPIDISIPAPGGRKTSALWSYFGDAYDPSGRIVMDVPLPPIPGMSSRQRLEARLALGMANVRQALDGDLLVTADEKNVSTYRLAKIDQANAHFVLEGRREHTPLERLVGSYSSSVKLIDGLAYAQESRIGTGLSVYDVRDPARPRATGHFAVPKAQNLTVARLFNGELLLAGDRLYVLKPPAALQ